MGEAGESTVPIADAALDIHHSLMAVFLIAFGALFLLQLRWGVVGIHGGGIERSENPPLYWLAMMLMAACLLTLSYFHFFGT